MSGSGVISGSPPNADPRPRLEHHPVEPTHSRNSGSTLVRLLLLVAIAGLAARILRYTLDPQIYCDEAYLLNNVLSRDYAQLLQPLENQQVAPPAFLWLVRWCSELAPGDQIMRLVPFAAGLASIGLFAMVCRLALRGPAMWFALAVFSVSHVAIVSANRAKPYSTDLLVNVVLLLLAFCWLRRPQRAAPVIAAAILAPLLIWLSYTSVFVIGGLGLTMAIYSLVHRRDVSGRVWAATITFGLLTLSSFAVMYAVHLKAARAGGSSAGLEEFWAEAFPPLQDLPKMLWWLVTTHTGRLYSYPIGEKSFGSALPFMFWALGIIALCKRPTGRWFLAMLLLPQALLLFAASLHLYPYGGHPRVNLFLAPSMCLLIGTGIAHITGFLAPTPRRRSRIAVAAALLLIPLGEMGQDVIQACSNWRKPSIRTLLSQAAQELGPNDSVVCLVDPATFGKGGAARHTFEYYVQRTFGNRAHWIWEPDQFNPAAMLQSGGSVLVVEYLTSGTSRSTFDNYVVPLNVPSVGTAQHREPRRCKIVLSLDDQICIWNLQGQVNVGRSNNVGAANTNPATR